MVGSGDTLRAQGNARRLVAYPASTQLAALTDDDPGGRPIERTDMDAEPIHGGGAGTGERAVGLYLVGREVLMKAKPYAQGTR